MHHGGVLAATVLSTPLAYFQTDISQQQQQVPEFQKSVVNTYHTINDNKKALNDRVSLVKG